MLPSYGRRSKDLQKHISAITSTAVKIPETQPESRGSREFMPDSHEQQVRLLNTSDVYAIERLLRTSEYIYQRFTLPELPLLLQHYPAVGIFHDTTMHGFLLSQNTHAPTAWIGGFGVSWTESESYITILTTLIEHLTFPLMARRVHYLHYSGNDTENDWLRPILLEHGFLPHRRLYAYDKFDYYIP